LKAKGGNRLCGNTTTQETYDTTCAPGGFVEFAKKVGAKGIVITVNTFTDSPASARELAKYVAMKDIPVLAFSLGNEPADVHPTSIDSLSEAEKNIITSYNFPNAQLPAWMTNVDPKNTHPERTLQYLERSRAYALQLKQGFLE
jgi:hypothetical protein